MDANVIRLGRRAVAYKSWRWIVGMTALIYDDFFQEWQPLHQRIGNEACIEWINKNEGILEIIPDFRDLATKGCLLGLVRMIWNDPGLCTRAYPINAGEIVPRSHIVHEWVLQSGLPHGRNFERVSMKSSSSEVEALVRAIELTR